MNTTEQAAMISPTFAQEPSFQIHSLWVKDFYKLKNFHIQFNSNISVLIGENGSGKSTVIECIADIFGHLYKYFVLGDLSAAFIDNYIIEYFIGGKKVYIESHYSDSEKNTFAPIVKINGSQISATETASQRNDFIRYLPSKIILSYSGISKHLHHLNKHFEDKYIKEIIDAKKNYSLLPISLPNENPFLYIKEEYVSFITLALMIEKSDSAAKLLETIGLDINSCKISISIKKPSWAKPNKTSTYPWGILGKVSTDFIDGLNSFGSLVEPDEKKKRYQYDFYGVLDIQAFFEYFKLPADDVLTFFDALLCDDLLDSVQISWKHNNESFSLGRLSEGEQQLLLSEGLCIVLNKKNILLLMDEPDVSLHPKWQREFIPNIRDCWGGDSMMLVTTHSPNLVSSLSPGELQLIRDGRVITKAPKYFGKPVEDILIDYFDLSSTRSVEAEGLINQIWNKIKDGFIDTEEFSQMLEELQRMVGRDDKELFSINLGIIRRRKADAQNK